VKAAYAKYGDRVDIVVVNDLVTADYTDILKGVYGIIYVASVLPGSQSVQTTIEVSICFPPRLSLSNHLCPRPTIPLSPLVTLLNYLCRSSSKELSTLFDKPMPRESAMFHTPPQ